MPPAKNAWEDHSLEISDFVHDLQVKGTNPVDLAQLQINDATRRLFPRLASVPERSLQRRFLVLKLLNTSLDAMMPLVDLSRRAYRDTLTASICDLQHLLFYSVKASFHNLVLEWTSCVTRSADGTFLSVQLHRPGRRARDTKEKAEDHERWHLKIDSTSPVTTLTGGAFRGAGAVLEEFLVAPSDFGGAREMGADGVIASRLVRADPPNASMPLRNADEVRGSVVLIERGGGQFVNVIRVAQDAGAVAVVIADSREGALFLMSTELGSSGDEVKIPAVLLSLADSMLLMQRPTVRPIDLISLSLAPAIDLISPHIPPSVP